VNDIITKWELEPDELIRRRLGKTGEEMGEFLQIKERVLLQGIEATNPSTGELLKRELANEVADVYAQLDKTVQALGLSAAWIEKRRDHKKSLMDEWEAMYKPVEFTVNTSKPKSDTPPPTTPSTIRDR